MLNRQCCSALREEGSQSKGFLPTKMQQKYLWGKSALWLWLIWSLVGGHLSDVVGQWYQRGKKRMNWQYWQFHEQRHSIISLMCCEFGQSIFNASGCQPTCSLGPQNGDQCIGIGGHVVPHERSFCRMRLCSCSAHQKKTCNEPPTPNISNLWLDYMK